MKNIRVSVDDELHRRARNRAAERNTSITTVVREFLEKFAGGETDFERRKRLPEKTLASITNFRVGETPSRENAHDRDALC